MMGMLNSTQALKAAARILVILAAAILVNITASDFYQLALGRVNPAVAYKAYPLNSDVVATGASLKIIRRGPQYLDYEDFSKLRFAILMDPLNRRILRSLAVYYDVHGDPGEATFYMTAATAVSRRDFITEMWLAEYYNQKAKPSASLRHYNNALLIQPSGAKIIFPRLVALMDDWPSFKESMKINFDRPWFQGYFQYLTVIRSDLASDIIVEHPAIFTSGFKRELSINLLQRLAEDGDWQRVATTFESMHPSVNYVRYNQTGYDERLGRANFDWLTWSTSNQTSVRIQFDSDRLAQVELDPYTSGAVVHRYLNLHNRTNGQLQLLLRGLSGSDAESFRLDVACKSVKGLAPIKSYIGKSLASGVSFGGEFTAPLSCHQLKLTLVVDEPVGTAGATFALDLKLPTFRDV